MNALNDNTVDAPTLTSRPSDGNAARRPSAFAFPVRRRRAAPPDGSR
jgi:hypothetical protein